MQRAGEWGTAEWGNSEWGVLDTQAATGIIIRTSLDAVPLVDGVLDARAAMEARTDVVPMLAGAIGQQSVLSANLHGQPRLTGYLEVAS